jgi:hypothetical protein
MCATYLPKLVARVAKHPALWVTAIAVAWSLVLTYPLILNLDKAVYGPPGDGTGTVFVYWWFGYALHHGMSPLNNTMVGAPLGSGWDLIPFNVFQFAILGPLSALIGPTLTYNLEVLSSFPLTAGVTYLLARRLGISSLGAAFSALAFTFAPYHLEKATGHVGQTHLEVFSAFLLFSVRWRQGGSRWNLVAAGAVAGLTLWLDFYYAFILASVAVAFFVVSLISRRERESWQRRLQRNIVAAGIVSFVAMLFVPAAILVAHRPSSGSYAAAILNTAVMNQRSLGDLQIYTARWWEYLLPWHANPLLPQSVRQFEIAHLHGSNFVEQSLSVGYTVTLLGVLGLAFSRRWFAIALAVAVALTGFIMAQPPFLNPRGAMSLHAPSYYLNALLPFFRVYSRFGLLVLLGAALLAGLGLGLLQRRFSTGRLRALTFLPFLLLALEFNNVPPSHVTVMFPAPAEYVWLAAQPAGILVEYPLHEANSQRQEIDNRGYEFYQQVHQHAMFNGSQPATQAGMLEAKLEPYSSPVVVTQLRELGIRYVFVHVSAYQQTGQEVPSDVPGLKFVKELDGTYIFVVSP